MHPATLLAMAIIVGIHGLIQMLAGTRSIAVLAEAIARGSGAA